MIKLQLLVAKFLLSCVMTYYEFTDKVSYNMDDFASRINNYDKYSELEWYYRPIQSWDEFK